MVVTLAASYIAMTLLKGLVIPEIAKKLASKAAGKGARLKDIEGPRWLRQIGKWLDDHQVSSPTAIKGIINEHQEEILRVLEAHEGELSELGKLIFGTIGELKERIDTKQLTPEDREFLAVVKRDFDPDEFEKRLEKILKEHKSLNLEKIRNELTTFFDNMGWGDQLDIINSKLDLVLENLTKGIRDIQERLERIVKWKHIEIRYLPEIPPDVSEFVDRESQLQDLINSVDRTDMIVIQGIAGIGKTLLAAKLMQNLENDYITFWFESHDFDTFDSISRNIAGFLKERGDPELAEYLVTDTPDYETIINILIRGLENKKYVLFFDNYHAIENKKIHDLFGQLKNRLEGSTIVITTRNTPPFINPIDRVRKKVIIETVDGFDLAATKDYLNKTGLTISPEQLLEVDNRMNGHPVSLLMFVSLAIEMEIEDILENLPGSGAQKHLFDEIYHRLSSDERRVLEALSIFRTSVPSEACEVVAKNDYVKNTLKSLEKKLLVRRKGEFYSVDNLIRDLSYNKGSNPKDYHRLAGEYYAKSEKTPENILEAMYHKIKEVGVINIEVIDYLIMNVLS